MGIKNYFENENYASNSCNQELKAKRDTKVGNISYFS